MSLGFLRSLAPVWRHGWRQTCRRWPALIGLWCVLLLTTACQKQEAIVTVPTETEANEIIAVLQDRGIEAKKEAAGGEDQKGWRILVVEDAFASGKAALAIRILQELGLPRPTGTGLGEDTGGDVRRVVADGRGSQKSSRSRRKSSASCASCRMWRG